PQPAGPPQTSLHPVSWYNAPSGARPSIAAVALSPTAHPRRVQLPAGGRHVRARPSGESAALDVGALREHAYPGAAGLCQHLPDRPGPGDGCRTARDRPPLGRGVAQCRANGRGPLLDAPRLGPARLGAAGEPAGSTALRALQLLDE